MRNEIVFGKTYVGYEWL